jgi:hypothetical protein
LGRLKSTVYARMEEMSFRSGAAVTGGVLAAAGVAVTLAVLLGGHSDAATSAAAPEAGVGSVPPPSAAPASVSPTVSPTGTSRASRTTAPATAPATAAGAYQPSPHVSASATARAAATPTPGRTTPWHPMRPLWSPGDPGRPGQPGAWGWPRSQPDPWPWGLLRHH